MQLVYINNEYIFERKAPFILLFAQQKRKHAEIVFLTSRSASKHILLLLVLILEPGTPVKAGVST